MIILRKFNEKLTPLKLNKEDDDDKNSEKIVELFQDIIMVYKSDRESASMYYQYQLIIHLSLVLICEFRERSDCFQLKITHRVHHVFFLFFVETSSVVFHKSHEK